jgi:hypothetical protein
MKVYIGKHVDWFGPYQLAEALCFWAKPVKDEWGISRKPEWVHSFGEFLAHGFAKDEGDKPRRLRLRKERPETFLYKFLNWVHSKKKRIEYIKIDNYDCWNIDATLSPIILPMLKQLRSNRHGSAYVDLDDVPEELKMCNHPEWDQQKCFEFYAEGNAEEYNWTEKRWDYVLDEMIFAFECKVDDSWQDKFRSGEFDTYMEPSDWYPDGKVRLYEMKYGPDHTYTCDYDGMRKVEERIQNGFRLFGKYYQNLWD